MADLPYWQFYARDWLADWKVRSLTPAARAAFVDCLAMQWLEGYIPDDPEALERITGVPAETITREVFPHFPKAKQGRQNEVQHRIRVNAEKRYAEASDRNRKNAKSRWDKGEGPRPGEIEL